MFIGKLVLPVRVGKTLPRTSLHTEQNKNKALEPEQSDTDFEDDTYLP